MPKQEYMGEGGRVCVITYYYVTVFRNIAL